MHWTYWIIIAIVLFLGFNIISSMYSRSMSEAKAQLLGIQEDGRLLSCSGKKNCVGSSYGDHHPVAFDGPADQAWGRITEIVGTDLLVLEQTDDYLRGEAKSSLFGYVDDVELLLDRQERVIHFRSASRVGKSDFKINLKRIEHWRQKFAAEI